MYYMGMDVHARLTMICVLDANGKQVLAQKVCGAVQAAVAAVGRSANACTTRGWRSASRPPAATAGCSTSSSRWPSGWWWSIPGQVRLIFKSKRKNDRIDAAKLAKLLYLGEVPAVHVPKAEGRAWRRMVEHRATLIAKRTAGKNALKALLRMHGVQPPKSLWSRQGLAWLQQLALEDFAAVERDQLLEQLQQLAATVRRVEKALQKRAVQEPAVALLRTIPGVGPRTAEAVAAYVDDPARFHSIKAIGCYFGVVPGEDTSVQAAAGPYHQGRPGQRARSAGAGGLAGDAAGRDLAGGLRADRQGRSGSQEDRDCGGGPPAVAGDAGDAQERRVVSGSGLRKTTATATALPGKQQDL